MKTIVWRIVRNPSNALVLPMHSMTVLFLSLFLLTACNKKISDSDPALVPATSGPVKIGEEIERTFETPHPYKPPVMAEEPAWSDTLTFEGAEFITPYFSKFELAAGDYVIVRSPDGKQSWRFDPQRNTTGAALDTEFWGLPVYGTSAIVELFSTGRSGAYGYRIDKFFRGFKVEDIKNADSMQRTDCDHYNAVEPICLQSENPAVYESSRAVVRIYTPTYGFLTCSGFLVGSEGHLLTTNRCVPDSATASNIWVEFMGQSDDCASPCHSRVDCPGVIEAMTATLVKTDDSLDYSLLKLPGNFSDDYGYLQLRVPGPKLGERVYIPYYDFAAGKRIALLSDRYEAGVPSRITSTGASSCRWRNGGNTDVSYYANLSFGGEGAPVLSYQDHHVIALNHCDPQCPNQGVSSYDLALDLGADLPADALYIQSTTPVEVTLKRVRIVDDAPLGGVGNPPQNTITRVFLGVNGEYRGFPTNGNGMFPRGEWVDVPAGSFTYYKSLASDDLLKIHLHTYLPRIVSWHPRTGEPIFGPERHLEVRNEFNKDDRVPGDFQMNPGYFAAGNHTVRSNDDSGFFEAEYSIRIREVYYQ
jgi:hypothetical protein